MRDLEYFVANPDLWEKLTGEEQALAAAGELPDLGSEKEEVQAAIEAEVADGGEGVVAEALPGETQAPDPANTAEPSVSTKGGNGVIPYAELEAARASAKRFQELAETQAAFIAELQAAKKVDAKTGTTDATDAVVDEYTGEYEVLYKDLSPHFQKVVDARTSSAISKAITDLRAELKEVLAPIAETANDVEQRRHREVIFSAHPDAASIRGSAEFQEFLNGIPRFVLPEYQRVIGGGSAEEIVALLNEFRSKYPRQQQRSDATSKAASPQAKAKKVQQLDVPGSLSDIPSGSRAPLSDKEMLAGKEGVDLVAAMSGWDVDKLKQFIMQAA
jgi:hypothetical protein